MDVKPTTPQRPQQPPRRPPVLIAWQWVFNIASLALVWLFVINWPRLAIRIRLAPEQSLFRSPWLLLLATVLVLLGTAALHELGHLLAGRAAGLRFQMLGIGPLRLSRAAPDEQLRLTWQRPRGLSLFDGVAASLPDSTDNLPRRMLIFALGGPLFSLLQVVLSTGLFFFLVRTLDRALQWAWVWEAALLSGVVAFLFLLTAIRPGPYPNGLPADGQRIWMLLTDPPTAERWCALVALNALDNRGIRPRDWPAELLQRALARQDNDLDTLHALLLAAQTALDRQEWKEADDYFTRALDLPFAWSGGMASRFAVEKAFLAAWQEGDIDAAESWLARLSRSETDPAVQRLATAFYLAAGDLETARLRAARARDQLRQRPRTGTIKAELALLESMFV